MEKKVSLVERVTAELINEGICSVDESKNIAAAYDESSTEHFDMFLLEEEWVDKGKLLKILSNIYEVPSFDVTGYFFDHELLLLFPRDFLVENLFIPLKTDEETLYIIMNNPADMEVLETIGNYVSYNVEIQVGVSADILEAIEEYYDLDIVSDSIEEEETESDEEGEEDSDIVDFI